MNRLIYLLLICAVTTPVAWAQTPAAASAVTNTASTVVSPQTASQANSNEPDCECESQVLPETLAVVNGVRITRNDIEAQLREFVTRLHRQVIEARLGELDLQINSKLVAAEAKRRGVSIASLLDAEVVAKVKEPTDLEARSFFAQHQGRVQGDFNEVKSDIIRYLREQRQTEEAKKFAGRLRADAEPKVQILEAVMPKNGTDRARVLAIVNGQSITVADIEDSLRPLVYAVQEQVYKLRKDKLDLMINDTLLAQASQKRKVTTVSFLETETKPKPVTDEDARIFYEQNKERVSGDFTQTKASIVSYLQQRELRTAQLALVEKLRAAASLETFLQAPKLPVSSVTTNGQP